MKKKMIVLAILLLSASFAPSLDADCPPQQPLDNSIWCRARCQSTGWCQWSLAYNATDSCFSGTDNNCTQLNPPHCQCTSGSMPLF